MEIPLKYTKIVFEWFVNWSNKNLPWRTKVIRNDHSHPKFIKRREQVVWNHNEVDQFFKEFVCLIKNLVWESLNHTKYSKNNDFFIKSSSFFSQKISSKEDFILEILSLIWINLINNNNSIVITRFWPLISYLLFYKNPKTNSKKTKTNPNNICWCILHYFFGIFYVFLEELKIQKFTFSFQNYWFIFLIELTLMFFLKWGVKKKLKLK